MPLIPIALATGWSAGVLFVLGLLPGPLEVELNPMSVDPRRAGDRDLDRVQRAAVRPLPPGARGRGAAGAGDRAAPTRSTGAAVLASGVTAIAGFAALIASDIRMLRDFGILDRGGPERVPARRDARAAGGAGVGRAARAVTLRDLDPRPLLRELRAGRTPADAPRAMTASATWAASRASATLASWATAWPSAIARTPSR